MVLRYWLLGSKVIVIQNVDRLVSNDYGVLRVRSRDEAGYYSSITLRYPTEYTSFELSQN